MKRILVVQKLKAEDREVVVERLGGLYELIFPADYSGEELARIVPDADICIGTMLPDCVMDAAPEGLIFQSLGTGVDRLNLPKAVVKGIVLCNSHSHSIYVAEFAVSLLFSLVKKTYLHDRMMRNGIWWYPRGQADDQFYLSDTILCRKIGFIGFGHIGQHIAKMLAGFDVSISAFNSSQKVLVEGPAVEYRSKEEIVAESDVIFIVLPLTGKTKGLIRQADFKAAKNSSLWVNISRGPVVCEKDLFDALNSKEIAGFAIDTWFGSEVQQGDKKYPSGYAFHLCENALLSPHRAIYVNGMSPHLEDALSNLEQYAKTGILGHLVNMIKGY